MSRFVIFKLWPRTIRIATVLLIIIVLSSSKLLLADWESFTSAPVESAESKTIRGFVSKPEGIGPFPAIIIAHGCFGVQQNYFEWAQRLSDWGYVTVIVDSFAPREAKNVCSNPYRVSPETRALDVYGAAAYLRKQSFVNPQKIGLIGFSHGGWTALCAAQKPFPAKAQEAPLQAVVAYYPWCPWFGLKQTNTPLLVLMGKEDNWTPLDRCEKLLGKQEKEFTKYVDLIAYDSAYHDFDDSSKEPPADYDGYVLAFNGEAAAKSITDTKTFFARYLGR
jgi:dienelactone hydrolase